MEYGDLNQTDFDSEMDMLIVNRGGSYDNNHDDRDDNHESEYTGGYFNNDFVFDKILDDLITGGLEYSGSKEIEVILGYKYDGSNEINNDFNADLDSDPGSDSDSSSDDEYNKFGLIVDIDTDAEESVSGGLENTLIVDTEPVAQDSPIIHENVEEPEHIPDDTQDDSLIVVIKNEPLEIEADKSLLKKGGNDNIKKQPFETVSAYIKNYMKTINKI
jgi:hypothetical protein